MRLSRGDKSRIYIYGVNIYLNGVNWNMNMGWVSVIGETGDVHDRSTKAGLGFSQRNRPFINNILPLSLQDNCFGLIICSLSNVRRVCMHDPPSCSIKQDVKVLCIASSFSTCFSISIPHGKIPTSMNCT